MTRVRPVPRTALVATLLAAATGCYSGTPPPGLAAPPPQVTAAGGVAMVLLRGGTFRMGAEGGTPDEAPAHEVTVSPFAMDVHEVTQQEFARLELPDPSQFKGAGHPVEQVRWSDAATYCNERSRAEGLEPCYDEETFACDFDASGYRLPTEAEWEYAARAGGSVDPTFGFRGGAARLPSHACYAGNSGERTSPVGRRRPNAWGLHDLYGNVAEWCHDVYDATYYTRSDPVDPRGPTSGKERVLRGGSWAAPEADCRPTRRWHDVPGITDACFARNTYGFRCVRRLRASEEALVAGDASSSPPGD